MVSVALDRSVELSSTERRGNAMRVVAFVDDDGDLIVLGHDPDSPPDAYGDRAYDHWVVVGDEVRDLVLLELLRERFEGIGAPTAEFMQWLQGRGIPHEVGTVAGEHRGPARIGAKGRRRNGAHGARPTRAGP
jgi:hypothetical protein